MRLFRMLLMLVCLAAAATAARAQTPNFSGKWTIIDAAAAPQMGGLGSAAAIAQDATSMTVTRTTGMGEFTAKYNLDGTESKNTMTVQGNTFEMLSKTKWEGPKLHINTSMSFDGNPVQVSIVMALDPSGNLVVETTRPDFQGGGGPVTTKTAYKKN